MYVGSFKPCHSRQLQEMPNNLLAPISTPVAERQQEPVSSPDVEVEYFEDDSCVMSSLLMNILSKVFQLILKLYTGRIEILKGIRILKEDKDFEGSTQLYIETQTHNCWQSRHKM